jgi:hypothetical protein
MKALFEGWRAVREWWRKALRGSAHRHVTLLGPGSTATQLLGLLIDAEINDVTPLQVDSELAHAIRTKGASEAKGETAPPIPAVYVPARGRPGRRYRWMLHASAMQGDPSGEAGIWKQTSNVFIVCWPFDRLASDDPAMRDQRIRIVGIAGHARKQGRLRRVAVAITGMPDAASPGHASQAWLEWNNHEAVRAGLANRLAVARGRPGDPLADPRWREVLETKVARDGELMRLVETLRRSVGPDCPLFFIPKEPKRDEGISPLFEWLERGGRLRMTPQATRLRRACVTASGLLAAALTLAVVTPPGLDDPRSSPRFANPPALHEQVLKRTVSYSTFLALPRTMLGPRSAEAPLERALAITEDYARCGRAAAAVRARTHAILAGVDTLPASGRRAVADSLSRFIKAQLDTRDPYLSRWTPGAPPSNGIRLFDGAMARAILGLACLRMTPVNAGFGGWQLDRDRDRWTRDWLSRLGSERAVLALDQLLRAQTAIDFYRACLRLEQLAKSSRDPTLDLIARTAPRITLGAALHQTGQEVGLTATMRHSRLTQLPTLRDPVYARFVRWAPTDQAKVDATIAAAGERHPMVVRFRAVGASLWHVDVSTRSTVSGFEPARWPAGASATEGCEILIPDGTRGISLWLRANRSTPVHAAPAGRSCTSGVAERLDLTAPSGTIRLRHSGLTLLWAVTEGWDTPDPVIAETES